MPEEEIFTDGAPFDWVKVTVPRDPETSSWPVKPSPAAVVAEAGASWVILSAVSFKVKLQIPVSPRLSLSVPFAL